MIVSGLLAYIGYAKIVGYVAAGYAAARTWFSKEIAAGKAELVKVESTIKKDLTNTGNKVKVEIDKVL
jgi:hypothetical protein